MNTPIDDVMERTAGWVVEKHLETPAVMFLEMNKPLSFVMGQSLYFGAPILAPLFGYDRLQKFAGILSDHNSLESLIKRIEQMSAARMDGTDNEQ